MGCTMSLRADLTNVLRGIFFFARTIALLQTDSTISMYTRVYSAIVRSALRLYKKRRTKTIVRRLCCELLYRASVRMAPRGFCQWLDCTMSFLQVFHVIFVRSYCTIDCTKGSYKKNNTEKTPIRQYLIISG